MRKSHIPNVRSSVQSGASPSSLNVENRRGQRCVPQVTVQRVVVEVPRGITPISCDYPGDGILTQSQITGW